MDTFKAFFLLLLTLILNVQLSSSAPMSGAFAEEPGLEELTPVDEEESEEKHIPVVPEDNDEEDSAPETPPISVIPLEASEDEAPEDNAEAELLPSAPEKETSVIPAEPQTGEAGQISDPEEQTETVPVIFAETNEEETPDESVKEEEAVGGEGEGLEEAAPEDPAVEDSAPEASVPLIPAMPSEDEVPEDTEGVPQKMVVTDPDVNAEDQVADQMGPVEEETAAEESALEDSVVIVPATDEDPEEEEAVVIFPIEPETDGEDELETATEGITLQESVEELFVIDILEEGPVAPEDTLPGTLEEEEDNYLIPVPAELETEDEGQVETAPQAPPEATIPIVSNGASEDDVSEDNADAPELILLTDPDDSTEGEHPSSAPHDDTSVVVFPIELDTEVEGQAEAAAEGTLQESAGEDLVVIVLTEREEETTATAVGATENGPVPVVPEENTEEDPATEEESPPSTPEEEDSLVPAPAEPETEGESQEEAAPEDPIIQDKAEDLNVAATMKKDEPVGQANRGAMLGAALLTQMSLIIIGFVGTNV